MEQTVNLQDVDAVVDLFDQAAATLHASPVRQHSAVRLAGHGRLLATGDLHDNPIHLAKIVKLARLADSPDHHVVLHEMIHSERLVNGVDLSHRMLAKVAQLVVRFPGQVHPLLANHELSQMTGKGVSKGAGNSVELFKDGLAFVFGDAWEQTAEAINRFIAAMPLALLSESGVFCAHSLPAPRAMKSFDTDILDRDLTDDDYLGPSGSAYQMVWGRGHTSEQIDDLARRWGVRLFCLGHEHAETGVELKHARALVLNSDHRAGAVLPIDLSHIPTAEEALMYVVPLGALG